MVLLMQYFTACVYNSFASHLSYIILFGYSSETVMKLFQFVSGPIFFLSGSEAKGYLQSELNLCLSELNFWDSSSLWACVV